MASNTPTPRQHLATALVVALAEAIVVDVETHPEFKGGGLRVHVDHDHLLALQVAVHALHVAEASNGG